MEESPQSYPAGSRKKPRTPPLPPACIEQPGIDLGAFFLPSVAAAGRRVQLKRHVWRCLRPAWVRITLRPLLPGSRLDSSGEKIYMHEGGLQ